MKKQTAGPLCALRSRLQEDRGHISFTASGFYSTTLNDDQSVMVVTTLTSEDGKHEEHDGIEEAETQGQGVLVHQSRDDKDGQHGSCSEFPVGQLQGSEQEQRGGRGVKIRAQGSAGNLCHRGLQDCHWEHISRAQTEESLLLLKFGGGGSEKTSTHP